VLASCYGEVFRLEPLTGRVLWQNPLKGFGLGPATIASGNDAECGHAPVLAEKRRRDGQAASAAAAAAAAG
jgi:hypothetical protein